MPVSGRKSVLATGLMILLVGVFGLAGVIQAATVYVDDDNTSGPWDGTLAHPYEHIQDGINNANPKDTVFVLNGTYYENVLVDKSILLKGEDRENTIVDASGDWVVIHISADSVQVFGFTVRNSGHTNVGIFANLSDDAAITNNIVTANNQGIGLFYSERVTVSRNAIIANDQWGLYLYRSPKCIISQNTVIDNRGGIYLIESDSNDVFSNTSMGNANYGIYIGDSFENTFFENNIENNGWGVGTRGASNNTIYHNSLANNTNQAYDEWSNIWDNGYPSGGNYWSDYTDGDEDGDDIGDTGYDIPGGDNQDRYPLMYPWGDVTVFVDDNADPSWYDSIHVATIQEGIDSALHEGFVYVHNGTYYENLTVGKKITLIGQYSDSVIVEGVTSGHLFSISVDSVLIKGFTGQNNSSDAAVAILSDHNIILANQIKSSACGIYLASAADSNTLSRNFAEANDYGIYLNSSSANSIMLNHFSSNSYGIYSQNSCNNKIILNHLSSNSHGIYSESSSHNDIYHNQFTGNTQSAYDDNQENKWDLGYGYYSCGNYWDDYPGTDTLSGLYQDSPGSDGIGDIPYAIGGRFNQDSYPLMQPWADSLPLIMLYCGDANSDRLVSLPDVVYLINYILKSGPTPVPVECIGDANGDTWVGIEDIVYLIGYILRNGPPPVDICCW